MTISHPANVKIDENNVLASGVDTIVLSFDVLWMNTSLFSVLADLKENAQQHGIDYPGQLKHFHPDEVWPFTLKPHGTKGFSWILIGWDFTFKIAAAPEPGSRPNVMIEIRSEALWRLGPGEAIKIALGLILVNGGGKIEAKISRLDLCLDFLMPERLWSAALMEYAVTRATDFSPYYHHRKLTGIRIGKGDISARLYDKPLEIQQQSKKEWMFDVWGLKAIPEGVKIIRIEFQLRREVLKELGIKTPDNLLPKIGGAWAYCTKNWLKFQDRPGLHPTQRTTFDWYQEIQDGFKGVQGAEPLVRQKAVQVDKRRLLQQANGFITSLHAIIQEEKGTAPDTHVKMDDCLTSYLDELKKHGPDPSEVKNKLARKRSKYHRERSMIENGQQSCAEDREEPFTVLPINRSKENAKELFNRLLES
ncbi:MAG: hypothetical protein JW836_16315 [Deltaproteobacteria bacterium]|nr:hypothetical protein [Deltaproteobacteria bacterium]